MSLPFDADTENYAHRLSIFLEFLLRNSHPLGKSEKKSGDSIVSYTML